VILGAHRDNAQRRRGGLTLSFCPFDTAYRRATYLLLVITPRAASSNAFS
jgi:hypothetical protein